MLDLARHQWRSVNGTFGVSRLVMRGDQPHPVPHGVVEALIAAADARGILQLGRNLQVGGPVRLLAGPFAEQLAILVAPAGASRAVKSPTVADGAPLTMNRWANSA